MASSFSIPVIPTQGPGPTGSTSSTTDSATSDSTSSTISSSTDSSTTPTDTPSSSSSATTPSDTASNSSGATSASSTADSSSSLPSSTSDTTSPPSSSSSSTSLSQSSSETAFITTGSNGEVTTSTSFVIVTPTVSGTSSTDSTKGNSKGFFSNTGAVAGVFSVVGIVALALIIALVTNAVRRRRAKKLDREIAEAAAEAAHAQPAFTDDDYFPPDDRLGKGGGGGDLRSMTTTGYSDTTHGTFAQPPLGHGESYNMAEMQPYDYGMGAAGAAGVGAMGVNRARSMGSNNQTQPYNAFAGPMPGMPNPYEDPNNAYNQQPNMRYRSPGPGADMTLLDAAGLGGGAAAGYAVAHQGYGQDQSGANLGRNTSLGPSQATSTTSPSEYSSYGQHPQAGYQQDYSAYPAPPAAMPYANPFQQSPPQGYQPQQGTTGTSRPTSMQDPYGGYVDEPEGPTPGYTSPPVKAPSPPPERLLGGNFASPPPSSEGHEHDEHRMSYQDEDDYGYEPRRVLKVANE